MENPFIIELTIDFIDFIQFYTKHINFINHYIDKTTNGQMAIEFIENLNAIYL